MFFFISCGQSQNKDKINNTKWEWKIDEDCINYIEFRENGIYQEYNCELGEKWEGEYKINADTLILMEKIYTSNIVNKGKNVVNKYKIIITQKGLSVIYSCIFEDDIWKEKWIKEPNIYFKKVK
jgi:hypothetical protein